MKRLHIFYHPNPGDDLPVAELAEGKGQFYLEWAPNFLENPFPLSPFLLHPQPGLHPFSKLPGLFDDALPDGWGCLLMDRFLRQQGKEPSEFTELDRLAWVGNRAIGALSFRPPPDVKPYDLSSFDLGRLAEEAMEVYAGPSADILPELLFAGGSPGGARPKVLVYLKGDHMTHQSNDSVESGDPWMVKFFACSDSPDTGAVEEAYARMAKASGLNLPETRLFETPAGTFFGVRRFDRRGTRRIHTHSLGNLVGADFRVPSLDYRDILKIVRVLTQNHQDTRQIFRQMVFNILSHNRDDHAKNFAFLFTPEQGWTLSPCFDLTFSRGPGGEHTSSVAGEGRLPGLHHIRKVAESTELSPREVNEIIDEVQQGISDWETIAKDCGVLSLTRQTIQKKFINLSG